MNLSELDLSVRSFNALKRARIETAEDAMVNLYKIITTHKMTARDLLDKLAKRGYLPFDVGHWLSDLDMDDVGEPIPFEDLDKHKGEMAIIDASTSSATAYRAVMLLGTHDDGAFGQYLEYYDGDNRRCYESSFTADKPQIYRIQNTGSRETESKPTVIVSDNYDKAVRLTRHIAANAHAMQESLYEVCKGLKEMRDGKLYKELGYQNFEDYTENEVGIRRRQAYTYISIAQNLSSDFVQSTAQIGTEKLGILAMLDEPQREEIQQTVDVEQVSVRELRQKIKDLETKNAKTEAELEESKEKAERSATDAAAAKTRALRLEAQITDLEAQVEQLENRPVEIAVSAEAEEKVQELQIKLATLRRDHEKQLAEIEQAEAERGRKAQQDAIDREREYQQEIDSIRAEYEQKLSAKTETVVGTKAVFKVHYANAIASIDKMFDFINEASDDDKAFFIAKAHALSARIASMADASTD